MRTAAQIEEQKQRLAKLAGDYDEAWSLGLCNGLGKACSIAIELGQPEVALAIIENGLHRFREKFEEELRNRRIDVAALGVEP